MFLKGFLVVQSFSKKVNWDSPSQRGWTIFPSTSANVARSLHGHSTLAIALVIKAHTWGLVNGSPTTPCFLGVKSYQNPPATGAFAPVVFQGW